MDDDVAGYIDAIDAAHRPLFDRVHRLAMEVQPDARVVLAYKMPTFVAGGRQLHVGVWNHGLSFYGWEDARDCSLVAHRPHLDSGRGTFKLPLAEAGDVTDDELRAFLGAALTD